MLSVKRLRAAIAAVILVASPHAAYAASEQQSLEEVRNTIVNLLQALVDQGLMTREKAAQLVKQAQEKAAADAAASARKDDGAVRVPYVPQIVKDDIAKQVAEEVKPQVVEGVVQQAKAEGWGVPGAMPDWLSHVKVIGDVRVRAQADLYASDNVAQQILDYNAINLGGGIGKVGAPTEFLNVTDSGERLRLRARLGAEVAIDPSWSAAVRLSTGSATDPSSESQNLGTGSARYYVGIDQGYIRFEPHTADHFAYLTTTAGRMPNPFYAPTELIYARDLGFEGVAVTGRQGYGSVAGPDRDNAFLTLGAFPVQYVPLAASQSKWMLAAQLGDTTHITPADRISVAAAYYDFLHVTGVRNTPDSTLLNYTAPPFIRFGNTYYDISNSTTDSTINLFALASHFGLANLTASYTHAFDRYSLSLTGDAVRNVGFNRNAIYQLTGVEPSNRNKGYVLDLGFGDPLADRLGRWRTSIGYRYVQGDAVLDAWTDADFHEGGTNAAGFYLVGDLGVADRTWLRLRYLSGNEIDGPRYGVDIVQLDLNTRF